MKRTFFVGIVLIVVGGVAFFGCGRGGVARKKATSPAVSDGPVQFEMAVYLLGDQSSSVEEVVGGLCKRELPELRFVGVGEKQVEKGCVGCSSVEVGKYPPPDAGALKYFGRGLSAVQVEGLGKCKTVWVVDFYAPGGTSMEFVKKADRLMWMVGEKTGGLVWDEETREVFAPGMWKQWRVDSWEGGFPDISKEVTMHLYAPGDGRLTRCITLGMGKFGRPDVVVNEMGRSYASNMGTLINVVCQTMAEQEGPGKDARTYAVDVDAIANSGFRERISKTILPGGTRRAELAIAPGKSESGDPKNSLIELTFANVEGGSAQERHEMAIGGIFGSKDRMSSASAGDAELLAASARAKAELPAEKAAFVKTLPVGEVFLVKAPFKDGNGGTEFMWVEVMKWEGTRISGMLQSEPELVKNLKAGASVTVSEAEVYDYIHQFADGTSKGNETGRILEKREGGK